jgi:ABC-type sugar transport system, permease component
MKKRKIRKSGESIAVDFVVYLLMTLYLLITLIPFLNVFSKAFSKETALVANQVTFYPIGFQLQTMKYVLSSAMFRMALGNSVFVLAIGTVITMFVTALAAYPLSKRTLPHHRFLTVLFVFTMWFSGGMVPTYLTMRGLGLTNTLAVLYLPGIINVYNMLLVKNYYESLPDSLEESARIDGASNIRILFQIVLPLSMPVLATVTLFTAVGLWNDYFSAMMYNTRINLKTLAQYLQEIVADSQNDTSRVISADDQMLNVIPEGVRAATIIASTVPILCIYPFLQKHFVKGVIIGAVKG